MNDTARRLLMTILLLGIAGLSVELLLLNHVEDIYQLIPLLLNGAAVMTAALVSFRPSAGTVRRA